MLVERESQLARLAALLEVSAAGSGRLVLLGGEAGVGKSSLTAALVATAAGRFTVRCGACDPVGTAAALGPLMDAFPEFADLIERSTAHDRPALSRRLRSALDQARTLLVVEDVHWADEATLDVLRFLGRRLAGLPLLAVATYRDDEAPVGSPLALLLGDLATAPGVTRLTLPALSVEAVRRLVEAAGSSLEPVELHRGTDGNPFYVTEVLAGGNASLPVTVRDAVLARVARLTAPAREVVAAAAVLGQRADLALLTTVSGSPAAAVDECVDTGVLVPDGDGWTFRHDLARRAVEQSLPPGRRAALHAVALRALGAGGERDDARLAHHAAGCGDRAAVLMHGERAAVRAARLGAHREAADLYRSALGSAAPGHPDRARLLEALSLECYLTGRAEEAMITRGEAIELAQRAGDSRAAGRNLRWQSRIVSVQGHRAESEELAVRAVETLEGADDGHELAMAYANLARLRLQTADTDAAVMWGNRAVDLAHRIGDEEAERHGLNTIGSALGARFGGAEGVRLLRRSLEMALRVDAHEDVARGYYNLGGTLMRDRRYTEADEAYRSGLTYCEARDLDAWVRHLSAGLAGMLADQGHHAAAEEYLDRARRGPEITAIGRMEVGLVACQIAVRRAGDDAGVLDELWALAEQSREEQWIGPVAATRAEAAWLDGRSADIPGEIDRAWSVVLAHGNAWSVGELCWWLAVGGARREPALPVAAPFRLMLEGDCRAAATAWEELGCPRWVAYALALSPDLADGRRAVALAGELDAEAVRTAILRERRARGLPVPAGPRSATRANPASLTVREMQVLEHLVEGLSNPEIARRLYLSERTVAHHVSAVLQKLGEPTRSRAVAAAVRRGIVGTF